MKNNRTILSELQGLKYYISFIVIVVGFYIYAMTTGYRVMSFKETTHSRDRTGTGIHTFFHK